MTYHIGIDPGSTGAIVLFDADEEIADLFDMPLHQVGTRANGNPKMALDTKLLAAILRAWNEHDELEATIEWVQSSPGGGATSMFTFGHNFGALEGVIHALDIPLRRVTPAKWKGHYSLKKDKKDSLALARAMWPLRADDFKLVKHADRAEAALIGHYGRALTLLEEGPRPGR